MTVPKPIALRLATTAGVLWVTMRFAVTAVRASALLLGVYSSEPSTFRTLVLLSPPAMLAFTGLVVAATFLDIRITGERILYANLAVRPAHIATTVVIVSVVLEGTTTLLLGVIWPGP